MMRVEQVLLSLSPTPAFPAAPVAAACNRRRERKLLQQKKNF